ncbi:MAG: hypothetical protein IH914_06075, partial [candidate division Zixibacteria bacterium]|nr:hypothetical protein [candidate division Zixibacteria bacterium]
MAKPHTRESYDPLQKYVEKSAAFPYLLIALMVLGLLALFRDFIFSNLMLAGSDMLNAGVFFRQMLVEHVSESGSPPGWNPYIFGGMPYVDAFHGDIFYPFSTLKFFGNIYRMLGWNFVLHFLLAGIFMYHTARQFSLSRLASSFAGLAYMFSGYLISLVAPGHDGKIFVTTLFPLSILFLDRAFQKDHLLNFALLGSVIGLIILTPHPQMSYFTLWALGLYTAYLLYNRIRARAPFGGTAALAGGAALAVALGLGVSAIQFYPGFSYTKEFSPRADTKSGYGWATSWSLHEEDVVGLIAPEFGGVKVNQQKYPNVYYWGKNAFKDNSEYAGVVALFLAVIGAFFYRRKGIFFGGLALFALSYALADTTPLFKIYYHLIPNVQSLRAASMIMFIFSFCVSLLAAMGIQWLLTEYDSAASSTKARLKKYLLYSSLTLAALALLWSVSGEGMLSAYTSVFYSDIKRRIIQGGGTKWQMAVANLPAAKAGFWISFVLVGAAAGTIWMVVRKRIPRWALLALPLLALADGLRFDGRFVETVPQARFQQTFGVNGVTQFIKSQQGTFRTMQWGLFSGDLLPFHGIEIVSGYHGNQLRWYDDLLGGPAQVPNRILGGAGLTNITNGPFLNLVGARFLAVRKSVQFPPDHFGDKPLTIARDFGGAVIIENPNYFPRAFFVDSIEVIPDRANIYPRILSGA